MNSRSTPKTVRLTGELDIARKVELRAALVIDPQAKAMLIDLSDVTYADSTALAELLRLSTQAGNAAIRVALIVVSPQFSRVIRYAGLDQAFRVFGDRTDALAYLEEAS